MASVHQTVLLQELIEALNLKPESVVVDGTLGGGGHAREIVKSLDGEGVLIGIDADHSAIERVETTLSDARATVHLVEDNFRNLDQILSKLSIGQIDALLLDLGLSSDQLEPTDGRGFSFRGEERLQMTFATTPGKDQVTARDIVNEWSEEHIADILYGFSEERLSRRIAKAIVTARVDKPIETTTQLVAIIESAVPGWYRHKKIHPATKTFQALRMAVNDELGALKEVLTSGIDKLSPNGRIAVITFHSVEDRAVKQFFVEQEKENKGRRITKKPITPKEDEIKNNPRARSAKLRIFEKK